MVDEWEKAERQLRRGVGREKPGRNERRAFKRARREMGRARRDKIRDDVRAVAETAWEDRQEDRQGFPDHYLSSGCVWSLKD